MKRETFVQCITALLAEADDELLREAEGLVFWRKRELRAAAIQGYKPGQLIHYKTTDGQELIGEIDHLNRYSVTVMVETEDSSDQVRLLVPTVIPIERILGPYYKRSYD